MPAMMTAVETYQDLIRGSYDIEQTSRTRMDLHFVRRVGEILEPFGNFSFAEEMALRNLFYDMEAWFLELDCRVCQDKDEQIHDLQEEMQDQKCFRRDIMNGMENTMANLAAIRARMATCVSKD